MNYSDKRLQQLATTQEKLYMVKSEVSKDLDDAIKLNFTHSLSLKIRRKLEKVKRLIDKIDNLAD